MTTRFVGMELTERQAFILAWIKGHFVSRGVPPTVREIGKEFSMTPNGVVQHLVALKAKGAIDYEPRIARGIRIKTTCGHPVQCEREGTCRWCQEIEKWKEEKKTWYKTWLETV